MNEIVHNENLRTDFSDSSLVRAVVVVVVVAVVVLGIDLYLKQKVRISII